MNVNIGFPCGTREECLDLIDHLSRARGFKTFLASLNVKKHSVEVTLYGTKGEVMLARRGLIEAYKEWKTMRSEPKKGESIPLKFLMRLIKGPFPAEVLEQILRVEGHEVEVRGGEIVLLKGGLPKQHLLEVSHRLKDLLKELTRVKRRITKAAKHLILAYSYVKGVSVGESIRELTDEGYLKEVDGAIAPTGEWRSLLRKSLGEKLGIRNED